MPSNKVKWILIVIGLILLFATKIAFDIFSVNISNAVIAENPYLYVSSDKNYKQFIWQLNQNNQLQNPASFERLANAVQFNKRLKPGRYLLKPGMSNFDLFKLLASGKQSPVDLVFTGANTIEQLAASIGNQLETDSLQLMREIWSEDFLTQVQMDSANVIGLFIPNTYNFYWNTSAQECMQRLLKEYQKFWSQNRQNKALKLGLNQRQVSVLASIVQKESNLYKEMPLIAGVYLNRLNKGMPLQADPTLLFVANDPKRKRVTAELIAMSSPYNTYLNLGLPPGPICCPSVQAIDAVLNASKTMNYYFCAAPDFSGKHIFAKTLQEHNINAHNYRKALNKIGVFR